MRLSGNESLDREQFLPAISGETRSRASGAEVFAVPHETVSYTSGPKTFRISPHIKRPEYEAIERSREFRRMLAEAPDTDLIRIGQIVFPFALLGAFGGAIAAAIKAVPGFVGFTFEILGSAAAAAGKALAVFVAHNPAVIAALVISAFFISALSIRKENEVRVQADTVRRQSRDAARVRAQTASRF